jgi:type I restriction enzyme M protein
LPAFVKQFKRRPKADNAWVVPLGDITKHGFDLSARNPNRESDYAQRPALELVQSIRAREERVLELLNELETLLEEAR